LEIVAGAFDFIFPCTFYPRYNELEQLKHGDEPGFQFQIVIKSTSKKISDIGVPKGFEVLE
jgi:hypothetical protein